MITAEEQAAHAAQLPTPTLQWWPRGRPHELHTIKLPLHAVFSIGRHPGCDLALADAATSRVHAELQVNSGRVRLVDLGSTNCTFVNSNRISAVWLRDGDQVRIGDTCLTVHYPTLDGDEAPRTSVTAVSPVVDPYRQLSAELIRLDSEYNGGLGRLKKREVELLLVDRMQRPRRTVQRMLDGLARQMRVDGYGSELIDKLAEKLTGRD